MKYANYRKGFERNETLEAFFVSMKRKLLRQNVDNI